MLTFMRDKFKVMKWVLVAVIVALVGWHFGIGVGTMGSGSSEQYVAMVGDTPTTSRKGPS